MDRKDFFAIGDDGDFSIIGYKSATIISGNCYKIMRSKGRSFAMNIISWMGDDRGNTWGPHCEGMGGGLGCCYVSGHIRGTSGARGNKPPAVIKFPGRVVNAGVFGSYSCYLK